MASFYHQPQQRYLDDDKDGSAGVHAPLLPAAPLPVHPSWTTGFKQPDESRRRRRCKLTRALGALAFTYLLYCGWVAYSRHQAYMHGHNTSSEVLFPHPPHGPHPHHPPPPPPAISVLGCVLIPKNEEENLLSEKVELSVAYPANATVILHQKLLFGNVDVEKVDDKDHEEMEDAKESTLKVAVKVAARPPFPGHRHPIGEQPDEEDKGFVLCATTLVPPPPPPPRPDQEIEGKHPGPPHPPVIVDIFPAMNETYPKLPPPPFPPHRPGRHHHHRHHRLSPSTIWNNVVSFLFPMFAELPKNHGHPCPGAPHPPLPPFIVTHVSATIPKASHVVYGPPPPPPFFHFPHPHPHPHHPHPHPHA